MEVENAGKCIECNSLLCVEGETHNCPDDDKEFYEQDIMCCDRCAAVLAKT